MKNINRILAPIDLSARSRPAVEHAVNIANHFGAEVIVLHAMPTMTHDATMASGYPGEWAWTLPEEREQQIDNTVAAFLQNVAPDTNIRRIVARGDAAQLIRETVEAEAIDLVVMPTSGAGAFRRFLLGSTTTKVLNDVACPVLTGTHVDDISVFAPRPYKKVGCALDLSEGSQEIVEKAQDFAEGYRADVLPIHTVQAFDAVASFPPQRTEEIHPDRLLEHATSGVRRILIKAGLPTQPIVEFGAPERVIPQVAEKQHLDLLVVGRHSSDGALKGLLSHAYGLIRNAPCPVLSV